MRLAAASVCLLLLPVMSVPASQAARGLEAGGAVGPRHVASAPPVTAPAAEVLRRRPFAPLLPSLFLRAIYPHTPPMAYPNGAELPAGRVGRMLDDYLREEFPHHARARAAARAVYESAAARRKVASPTLRAALAALSGTFARSAVGYILHARLDGQPKVTDVRWADPAAFSAEAVAEVRVLPTGQTYIQFNDRYRGADPFLFTSEMAHEPLHQDASVANLEESINHTFESLLYLHQLARHPWLAREGNALSRSNNTKAAVRLNSGQGATLGLFRSNHGRRVMPGSKTPAPHGTTTSATARRPARQATSSCAPTSRRSTPSPDPPAQPHPSTPRCCAASTASTTRASRRATSSPPPTPCDSTSAPRERAGLAAEASYEVTPARAPTSSGATERLAAGDASVLGSDHGSEPVVRASALPTAIASICDWWVPGREGSPPTRLRQRPTPKS